MACFLRKADRKIINQIFLFWKMKCRFFCSFIVEGNVVAINHFVTLAFVYRVFEIGEQVRAFKLSFQAILEYLCIEVVIYIHNIIIVGNLINRILQRKFIIIELVETVYYVKQCKMNGLAELFTLVVKCLICPEELHHQYADNGHQAKNYNTIEFVYTHASGFCILILLKITCP